MRRADSLEKTLMLGKIEGKRRRGQQRMRWLDGIADSVDMSLSKWRQWKREWGRRDREAWRVAVAESDMTQWGNSDNKLFSKVVVPFYIPNSVWEFQFPYIVTNPWCGQVFFSISQSYRYVVVSFCSFNVHFPSDWLCCHSQRSLAGYSPWDHNESDMTEQLSVQALKNAPQISVDNGLLLYLSKAK